MSTVGSRAVVIQPQFLHLLNQHPNFLNTSTVKHTFEKRSRGLNNLFCGGSGMTSKAEKDKVKQLQDKCLSVLNALLRDEDNKYCVDCDSKGPRWASWNLGVFLCIRCAGIHRNLGVHISKVKSVNLDAWTPEQVVSLQQMGNSRARAVYEANLPDSFRRPQNDSSLETFIRAKYEHKKYIAREWVPPALPEVNWEKEIDEEIERQKRKKKSAVAMEKKSLGAVEVPQLPKPKNASPKPGRLQTSNTETQIGSKTSDLLGLQNGDDSFSNFLSAPVAQKKDDEQKELDIKSEEESFFNQTIPTEKEKAKMTKDSILALYATAPQVTNFNPTYNQQAAPFTPNFHNFNAFNNTGSASSPFVANGSMQFAQFPQGSSQFHPRFSMQSTTMPQGQQVTYGFGNNSTQSQFHVQPNQLRTQQPQNAFGASSANQSQANPFTPLAQQFGNLSMNMNATNNAPSQTTLASNLWQ